MIKENILNFTAVVSVFVLTGSSVQANPFPLSTNKIETVYVKEMVYPTSPSKFTQLAEIDKIIAHYEGEVKVLEADKKLEAEKQSTLLMEEWAESNLFISNQEHIDTMIKEIVSYVGVTPYGYGKTPEIWDCSGLTLWYLEGRGIEVNHSATSQVLGGTRVSDSIAGDLVAFKKSNESDYFHIGVYVGGGLMVHASNPEKGTNLQSIEKFAKVEDSKIVFVRY